MSREIFCRLQLKDLLLSLEVCFQSVTIDIVWKKFPVSYATHPETFQKGTQRRALMRYSHEHSQVTTEDKTKKLPQFVPENVASLRVPCKLYNS